MERKIKNAIQAAFVADALSLGAHWEYDTAKIEEKLGRIEQMTAPGLVPYHAGKNAGDFTHYGDQMLVLLKSVSEKSTFNLQDFSEQWLKFIKTYDGYIDHATKESQINFINGKPPEKSGSGSTDLSGASRLAPVFLGFNKDVSQLVEDARSQAAMTHNHPDVKDTAEWITRTGVMILDGDSPLDAMEKALGHMPDAVNIRKMVVQGLDTREMETIEVIKKFGQMCALPVALPSAVHLVARYASDYKSAMIENVMAGGDSSARGMLAGFLIGCSADDGFIPSRWLNAMKSRDQIDQWLGK